MDKREKDIWVDEVLYSLQGLKPVEAQADIYGGVMGRLRKSVTRSRSRVLPRVAVAAVLLLSINILTVYWNSRGGQETANAEQVSQIINEQISSLDSY